MEGSRYQRAVTGLTRRGFGRLILAGIGSTTLAGAVAARGNTLAPLAAAATTQPTPAAVPAGLPSGGKHTTLEPVGGTGGHVTEASFSDARTLSPLATSEGASGRRIALIFQPLFGTNPDDALPYSLLAAAVPTTENGGISADGLTYTISLRSDVRWHDGTPFTARDVVFTYATLAKPELGSGSTAQVNERIESVAAPDDQTVVMKLRTPDASFLLNNNFAIAPEHILKDVPIDQINAHPFSTGDPTSTVGTGPFKFQEWATDDHMTLVKNTDYFLGEPALDQYVFKVVRDATVVVSQLKAGEVDYASNVATTFYDELSTHPSLTVERYDDIGFTFYFYQLDPAKTTLFQEKLVRQALAYALDRESMVTAIRFGLAQVAVGTMPPPVFAYAPDQITTTYPYDPQKAEQLLDEAGWIREGDGIRAKGGQPLRFTMWLQAGNNVLEQYATVMQQHWRAVGVDVTLQTEDPSAFLTRIIERKDFECVLLEYASTPDPDHQSKLWASTGDLNVNTYRNQQVDDLLARGRVETDQATRRQIYVDLQNFLVDDLPAVLIDFPQLIDVYNKRVHNLKPNAISVRWNIHTWWVDDGQ